jgi:pimeloyl-ACP methyl ester carboxylesterase
VLALADLEACRVPTLFIWGSSDSSVGAFAAAETAHHVDAPYRFEVLEDVGHFVTDQASRRVTEMLLEHLSNHR